VQWSGDCESPAAFLFARNRKLRPVGASTRRTAPESRALGWSPSGRPIVSFPGRICGSGYHGGPGVYSVDADGTPRLIVRTTFRRQLAFWG
jgi:hypothetical protein